MVDQACGYDERLEEANARVKELAAQLLEGLRRDEANEGFEPIVFISKGNKELFKD